MAFLNWDDPERMRWMAPFIAVAGLLVFILALIALFVGSVK
jgi:hypothetical protein